MQQTAYEERQPLLSIIMKPRDTFRYVVDEKLYSMVLYIGAVGGFSSELINFFQGDYPKNGDLSDVVYKAFTSGIISYLVATLLFSFLISIVSKWYNAKATVKDVFLVFCLNTIPYIWILPILLFWMQLSPETFFEVNVSELTLSNTIILIIGACLVFAAVVWNFILTLIGLSEVMQTSKWKAFGVLFVVMLFMTAVLLLVAFII